MKVCTACGIEYGDEVLFCQRDGTPLRPSGATADLVGQVIADRYHIQKKLGEGGMGQVYLAEHVKMGRRCAIKIMNQGLVNDADAISRFNREAANASRIGHTNVCAIYDFGETPDGLIYLAMEFIEGKSLSGLLEEVKVLPFPRAAAMITQCADALQVAHDLGIVHRDLKPDNIMVTTTGGKDIVKVVDFGIAKAVGADSGSQKVTKTGFVVGTPEYMSPEQLAGDSIDGRSDLYSLALVFYRMLTGSSPFPADSQQETMIKRLTDDPVPLATARPDVRFPEALQRIMDRALARTPTDRYAASADFGRDIRALSTTLTGAVDIEAGTQVVKAEDLRGPSTVPLTRIDPARAKAKAATGGDGPAARPKSFPLVPVAVAVVLIAALGGTIAFKDAIFGAKGDPITSQIVTPDTGKTATSRDSNPTTTPAVDPLSHPENPGTDPASGNNGIRDPKGTGTPAPIGRDIATTPIGTIDDRPAAVDMPDVEDAFDAAKRGPARKRAEAIYARRQLSDSVRAVAARYVAAIYREDQKFGDALAWATKGQDLYPNESGANLINQLKTLMAN